MLRSWQENLLSFPFCIFWIFIVVTFLVALLQPMLLWRARLLRFLSPYQSWIISVLLLYIISSHTYQAFSYPSMSTVIEHIVLLKVKPEASDEDIKKLIEGAQSLRTIPGVISITVGSTFAEEWMPDRRNGHTHTLSCRLQSKEGNFSSMH